MDTFGHRVFDALREAKRANPQHTRDTYAEIINNMLQEHTESKTKKRGTKPMTAMTEDEFLAFLESEPALKGVDVQREIGKCQFWCKANGVEPSRKRILNWMMKADKNVGFSGAGKSSMRPAVTGTPEPRGWKEWLNKNRPDSIYSDGQPEAWKKWGHLDETARRYIVEQMKEEGRQ